MLFHTIVSTQRMRELSGIPIMEGRTDVPLPNHTITFDHVRFAYNKEPVLNHVTATIPEGKITALVDPSGSGKSTMSRLIARFWDVENAAVKVGGVNVKTLDSENEVLIQNAISHLIKGKTVLVIAHRLRTIADADQILVLNNGNIEETGTHEQLMAQEGLYRRLYQIQAKSQK